MIAPLQGEELFSQNYLSNSGSLKTVSQLLYPGTSLELKNFKA